MSDLNRNDLEDILKLVNFCMAHIKSGYVDPHDLLLEMHKIFRSNDAEFFPSNRSLNGVELLNSVSIRESREGLVKYANHYWRYDPLYSAQFCLTPTNRVFKTDDVIPYTQLKKLDYYQEYLRHINWLGELVIRLCTEDGFWGTISLSRSPKQPYFDRSDIQKAELLLPYLINTFEFTMYFSKINGERKALEQWLETRPEGVILLDAQLRSLYFNDKARQICRSLSTMKAEASPTNENSDITLPRSIVEDCQCLANTLRSDGSFSRNRIINTKCGDRYFTKCILINQGCQGSFFPYIIIHINNLGKSDGEAGANLSDDYKLSAREELIARYIGVGFTNKEIAEKLCISPFTVQSHLRNIFEKTGIKRRAQLANLVR